MPWSRAQREKTRREWRNCKTEEREQGGRNKPFQRLSKNLNGNHKHTTTGKTNKQLSTGYEKGKQRKQRRERISLALLFLHCYSLVRLPSAFMSVRFSASGFFVKFFIVFLRALSLYNFSRRYALAGLRRAVREEGPREVDGYVIT